MMAHSRRFFGERNDHLRRSAPASGVPGYDVSSWYALYVPGKTPPDIVEKLRLERAGAGSASRVHDGPPSLSVLQNLYDIAFNPRFTQNIVVDGRASGVAHVVRL